MRAVVKIRLAIAPAPAADAPVARGIRIDGRTLLVAGAAFTVLLVGVGGLIVRQGMPPAPAMAATAAPVDREAAARAALQRVPITVYTTSWCPVCKRAKAWMRSNAIPFTERDVEADPKRRGRAARSRPREGCRRSTSTEKCSWDSTRRASRARFAPRQRGGSEDGRALRNARARRGAGRNVRSLPARTGSAAGAGRDRAKRTIAARDGRARDALLAVGAGAIYAWMRHAAADADAGGASRTPIGMVRTPGETTNDAPPLAPLVSVALPPDPTAAASPGQAQADRLARAMHDVPITMYSTANDGSCRRARAWLLANGYPFTDRDVERDPSAESARGAISSDRALPVLDIGGQAVVGFDPDRVTRALQYAAAQRVQR